MMNKAVIPSEADFNQSEDIHKMVRVIIWQMCLPVTFVKRMQK